MNITEPQTRQIHFILYLYLHSNRLFRVGEYASYFLGETGHSQNPIQVWLCQTAGGVNSKSVVPKIKDGRIGGVERRL
jgi:hypothetical protein